MATAGNGGAGQTSQDSAKILSDEGGNFAATGISELEQMLKQVTVSRFEIKQPSTMEDIPDDILLNIFIRLLARQLAQMRTVSKTWNALLSHPSFVKSHLHRSIHTNNEQILLVFSSFNKPFTEYSCKSPHLEPINFIKRIPTNLPMSTAIGAVNGLICLRDNYCSNIRIWNPSLSAVLTIPPPHYLPPINQYEIFMRFGFDPKNDDYKLVKISGICNRYFGVKEWLEVEVYSVKKGCWEFITQPFPSHITMISNHEYVCVDGHHGRLHWQGITGSWTERTIVGFDLGSETFREIPLPDAILDDNHIKHRLAVLDGKLCEMTWRMDGGWEVWVMEEYGMPESWAKRHAFSSSQFNEGGYLYGFTSRNELLLEDEEGRLVLYNPIANTTKFTCTRQIANKFVEYLDSLIWI